MLGPSLPAQGASDRLDACLAIVGDAVTTADWVPIEERLAMVVAAHPALFPSPSIVAGAHEDVVDSGGVSVEFDIDAGHVPDAMLRADGACLEPGLEWTARFSRPFLQMGAARMLAEAPTTPGIDSSVEIEWFSGEDRLRTTLVFAGPFDIPNGTCWIDDVLSIDPEAGVATASGDRGVRTSPFAESACGRFFDHLPGGGAGEQAITLFPREVSLADGRTLRFVASQVGVTDDAVMVGGRLEAR